MVEASYWFFHLPASSLKTFFAKAKTSLTRGRQVKNKHTSNMGAVESKSQMSPPETPQYLKYSHLKEIEDPRSPGNVPRTPIYKMDDKARLIDPRSPTLIVPRTPIYSIPLPEEEECAGDCSIDEKPVKEQSKDAENEVNNDDQELGTKGQKENLNCSISSISAVTSEVETSPEKAQYSAGLSDRGYLIKKSKGNKKRQRRRRNKRLCKDENVVVHSQQGQKDTEKQQLKRLPLASRNFMQNGQTESPSLDLMIKSAKKLSLNAEPKSLCFGKVEDLSLGKENLAAIFTP